VHEVCSCERTSEGPAGMSMEIMASLFCSSIFAAVTYWLPGPRILSTCDAKLSVCFVFCSLVEQVVCLFRIVLDLKQTYCSKAMPS